MPVNTTGIIISSQHATRYYSINNWALCEQVMQRPYRTHLNRAVGVAMLKLHAYFISNQGNVLTPIVRTTVRLSDS